ncbi:hypothetical protein SeMB42_g02679 [Synchytrium endobioticum]|uniref:SAPS-domain-containing protein n=1 Tax=Synchytrium endobioticum TaxID=286115 RepID=A0A507D5X0_9FUNG|nr:hypothetical protein SeLEV6574_g02994 [Synchytrium endobioticum]TPX49229.1 hypothetical protein SeMB42_g02679 [Synchytrium endobioticum]
MYWQFGFHPVTVIDGVLDKDNVTLDDLLEDEELLQECKAHNAKLIDFLMRPEILAQLLKYTTADDLVDSKKFKYPYIACEVISCEILALCEGIVSNQQLMAEFWTFLDRPAPLSPLFASYFSKVNSVLLQKKTADMVLFLREQPNMVQKLLIHIGTSAIADLLLKLISLHELSEGAGVVTWLSHEGLIPSLISRLDPRLDTEIHNTAAQTLLDIIAVSYQTMAPPDQQPDDAMNQMGGNVLIDELKNEAMMNKMVGYMLDSSAPYATSSLTNGINIIIELIRRYCSEIEQAEYQQHQCQSQQSQGARNVILPPSNEKLQVLATDLNELLHVVSSHLDNLARLLTTPRNLKEHVDTTIGKQMALGSERLKTCELFAEVLHLQYLYTSSPLFDRLVVPARSTEIADTTSDTKDTSNSIPNVSSDEAPNKSTISRSSRPQRPYTTVTVADELVSITEKFVEAKTLPQCLELFFAFPWNNFLHSVVYDMIAKVFNTYSFAATATLVRSMAVGESTSTVGGSALTVEEAALSVEVRMKKVKVSARKLVISIFREGALTERIVQAQMKNDSEVQQPKGVRLGYMGHLTYIAEEVIKLVEKCAAELEEVQDVVAADDWVAYVSGPFRDTKERDRVPLGGFKPPPGALPPGMAMGAIGGFGTSEDEEAAINPTMRSEAFRTMDDDEDYLDASGMPPEMSGTATYNDQFARYLVQQTVNDLPDRFLGAESDDDDDERDWMGEFDARDADFDMRDNADPDNLFSHKTSLFGDDFDNQIRPTETSSSSTAPNSIKQETLAISEPSTSPSGTAWSADFSNALSIPSTSTPSSLSSASNDATSFDTTQMKEALDETASTTSTLASKDSSPSRDKAIIDESSTATAMETIQLQRSDSSSAVQVAE